MEARRISAWCEVRNDFRHFRADHVRALHVLEEGFPVSERTLTAQWLEHFVYDVSIEYLCDQQGRTGR